MNADDIKPMLSDQDIDDIILTGGHRNAAGGIYATSVYAFAKEIAVAAVEASRASVAELPDSALTEAAAELRVCAEEIKAGHTIGGEWPDGEDDARIAHNRLHRLASALERMATDAVLADRVSRAPSPQGDAEWIPVAVRLPEWASRDDTPCYLSGKPVGALLRSQKVLVSLDGGGVRVDHLESIEDSGPPFWASFGKRVLAWKPAPAQFDAARSTPATEKGAPC